MWLELGVGDQEMMMIELKQRLSMNKVCDLMSQTSTQ